MHTRLKMGAIWALLLPALLSMQAAQGKGPWKPKQLWFYYPVNLQVTTQVDELEKIWRRAATAGYTHVLLADGKLARQDDLGSMTKVYAGNVARVKALAAELKLEMVVACAEFGYSEALLFHDPMLAEAVPVRGTLMEVRGGVARVVPDPAVSFGEAAFIDPTVKVSGATAEISDPPGNSRMCYPVKVSPFRCYHVRATVETEGYTGEPRIAVLDDAGRSLQYETLAVKRTQGPTAVDVVFNPLEANGVKVYLGQWGPAKGKLIWRDWKIEEAGPINIIRRAGAPVVLRAEGSRDILEGRDIDRIEDPLCGTKPWKGAYDSWHTPPVFKSKLPDGSRFRVDWWYAPVIQTGQVTICPGEEKTWQLVGNEFRDIRKTTGTTSLFLGFDEIRVLGWDRACGRETAGKELAQSASRAVKLAREAGAKEVYVWSDMFDPEHNAKKGYYLAKDDLAGSWEGLPKDVVVGNWNFGKRDASLKFFADRGHRQIVGAYYDGPLENTRKWLASAAGVKGVEGVVYCTWKHQYEDLEAFAKVCGR